MLVDVVVIAHARAREANELPSDHVGVSTVNGVGEHAFDGVLAKKRKEEGRFDLLKMLVLFFRGEAVEAFQIFQTFAVDFAGSGFPLIAELRRSIFKGALRVAIAVSPVRARELAININGDARFPRSGAGIVSRENAGRCGGDDESLRFIKEAEGNTQTFVLRCE